jgi:hypothetical protein
MARPSQDETRIDHAQIPPLLTTAEIGPFAEFNSRNVSTALRAGQAAAKGAAAYWSHVGAFMNKRLRADAEAFSAFTACRSGEEAVRAHHQFVSEMITDYLGEMRSMLTLGAEVARDISEPIEERTEEVVHNIEVRGNESAA